MKSRSVVKAHRSITFIAHTDSDEWQVEVEEPKVEPLPFKWEDDWED